ncbi:MAG: hypothetical protein ACT4OM_07790 [Actinomycetota bacterium]
MNRAEGGITRTIDSKEVFLMGAFRRGALIGFGVGYLRGAKAGRPRYEQITQKVQKMNLPQTMEPIRAKGKVALTSVMEKTGGIKDKVGSGAHSSSGGANGAGPAGT